MAENHMTGGNAPASLLRKLDEMSARSELLRSSLEDPAVLADQKKLASLCKYIGLLEQVVLRYPDYRKTLREVSELREMVATRSDPDMAALAEAELPTAEEN